MFPRDFYLRALLIILTTLFNSNHVFSQMIVCGECGELFRRVHWNNHGCRSIVWRCLSRLQSTGVVCHARTVNEEMLKKVVMQAFNELTEFIEQQDSELTEFDESLARRWLKEIVVWDDRFSVELKSGVAVEIEI